MDTLQARIECKKATTKPTRCEQCATRTACIISCVSESTAHAMASAVRERPFHKSEVLQVQGEVSQSIAIVKLGMVMGTRRGCDGVVRPVALTARGQLMGGHGLLGQPNQLGGDGLSAGRICEISIADLYRLGVMDRQFMECVYAHINAAIGRLADWAQVMHIKGVQQQLLSALQLIAQEQDHQLIRLPSHVALAALLSTTRETVARCLAQLEQQGLLTRLDRWHCQVNGGFKIDLVTGR